MGVLRWAGRRAATRGVNFYDRAHPRMDAALKAVDADRHVRASRRRTGFGRARRNENDCAEVQAFGRRYRIAGNAVEFVDEPAAKFCDLRKRVDFTATILNLRWPSNVEVRLAG